ncbi:mechanosensitive ion channel family protein [Echinicola vietnamensis]|uniref:Small-conductance mechanosensitive channel n=1 Tax=Echinicola vietnamensis (strain DSM 17526 / LMG 23754 / KMM 6221) TaxID=926556 RepID=L0G628_ECHVK|nr:mechanosensitive ion channel domain-containing protein [Echinicola vietnamensis]AGA80753.1 small-conductance mechanosensitive channel [Echinicola vietnamensis DSM 17526]
MKDVFDNTDWSFYLVDNTLKQIGDFLPRLFVFIVLLVMAWLIMRGLLFLIKKLLKLSKIDDLAENLSESDLFNHIKIKPSAIIMAFAKFFFVLLIIIFGADFLQLHAVSDEISKFLGYIPQVFVAIILFVLGVYLSIVVKKFIRELLRSFGWSGASVISNIVSYIILIIVSITALSQAGINTHVITDNLSLVLGAFLACFALAIGLGSREVVLRILYSFYSKKNYQIGQVIKFDNIEGEILAIDNISITLKTDSGKMIVPIKDLVDTKVKILSNE